MFVLFPSLVLSCSALKQKLHLNLVSAWSHDDKHFCKLFNKWQNIIIHLGLYYNNINHTNSFHHDGSTFKMNHQSFGKGIPQHPAQWHQTFPTLYFVKFKQNGCNLYTKKWKSSEMHHGFHLLWITITSLKRVIYIMFYKHVGRLTFLVNLFSSSKNSKQLLWENNVLLLNYMETKQLGGMGLPRFALCQSTKEE